jgi:hypothetical protein
LAIKQEEESQQDIDEDAIIVPFRRPFLRSIGSFEEAEPEA